MTSFCFQSLNYFLEIRILQEVLLAALFISVSNRYQKRTIYLLFVTGLNVFNKNVCNKNMFDKT